MPANLNYEGQPIDESGARFRNSSGIYARFDPTKRRVHLPGGTAVVAGDWAASAGWGTGASISAVAGSDTMGTVQVTAGSTPAANPTLTLTFHDGTFLTAPFALANINATSTAADVGSGVLASTTATTLVLTFIGTPTNTRTYTFNYLVVGKDQQG